LLAIKELNEFVSLINQIITTNYIAISLKAF